MTIPVSTAKFRYEVDDRTKASMGALIGRLGAVRKAAFAAGGSAGMGFLVLQMIKASDTITQYENRLKVMTDTQNEYNVSLQKTHEIANRTFVSQRSTVELYSRLEMATKSLQTPQEYLLRITESLNKAIIISGDSTIAAEAALVQLGQGLAADALRGQELNSVLEQTPMVTQMLVDGLKVSRGELRKMAEVGELTAKRVLDAFKSQSDVIDKLFASMTLTTNQRLTILSNRWTLFLDNIGDKIYLTEIVQGWIMIFDKMLEVANDAMSSVDNMSTSQLLTEQDRLKNQIELNKELAKSAGIWGSVFGQSFTQLGAQNKQLEKQIKNLEKLRSLAEKKETGEGGIQLLPGDTGKHDRKQADAYKKIMSELIDSRNKLTMSTEEYDRASLVSQGLNRNAVIGIQKMRAEISRLTESLGGASSIKDYNEQLKQLAADNHKAADDIKRSWVKSFESLKSGRLSESEALKEQYDKNIEIVRNAMSVNEDAEREGLSVLASLRRQYNDDLHEINLSDYDRQSQQIGEAYANEYTALQQNIESKVITMADGNARLLEIERQFQGDLSSLSGDGAAMRAELVTQRFEIAHMTESERAAMAYLRRREMIEQEVTDEARKTDLLIAERERLISTMERIDSQANMARMNAASGALGALGSLMMQGNKKQFEAGKKFARASVVVNTGAAIMQALAHADPWTGTALAIKAGIQGATQLASINKTQFGGGGSISAPGGGSGGGSGGGGSAAPAPAAPAPQMTVIMLGSNQSQSASIDDVLDQLEVEIDEGSRVIMSVDSRQVQNIIEAANA